MHWFASARIPMGTSRGKIKIVSRSGLKSRACACYGITDRIFTEASQQR